VSSSFLDDTWHFTLLKYHMCVIERIIEVVRKKGRFVENEEQE
jgi:hypothetical protein